MVYFLLWNLAKGAALPKTARWCSASSLFDSQHDLLVRVDAIALLLVLHKPLHQNHTLDWLVVSKTVAGSSHIFSSNCCPRFVFGLVTWTCGDWIQYSFKVSVVQCFRSLKRWGNILRSPFSEFISTKYKNGKVTTCVKYASTWSWWSEILNWGIFERSQYTCCSNVTHLIACANMEMIEGWMQLSNPVW